MNQHSWELKDSGERGATVLAKNAAQVRQQTYGESRADTWKNFDETVVVIRESQRYLRFALLTAWAVLLA